jgi:hypothetical protein
LPTPFEQQLLALATPDVVRFLSNKALGPLQYSIGTNEEGVEWSAVASGFKKDDAEVRSVY